MPKRTPVVQFVFFGNVVLVALFSASVARAADPSAEDLVASYEKTVSAFNRVSYRADLKKTYDGPKLPAGQVLDEYKYQIWRDGERWKFLISLKHYQPRTKTVTKMEEEWLFPGKGYVRIGPGHNMKGIMYYGIMAHLNELPGTEKWRTYRGAIGLMNGFLQYNGTDKGPLLLHDLLRQAKLSARQEKVDGKPAWKIEATSKWGSHTVWLDPAASYLPLRIVQRKKGADLGTHGTPLNALKPFKGGLYYPAAKLTATEIIVDSVKSRRVGGIDVFSEFTVRDAHRFDNGQAVTITEHVIVRDVKFDPDFTKQDPFTISTPVPDGNPVTVVGEENIQHEWRKGKVVKRIEPTALENLFGSQFRHSGWRAGLTTALCFAVVGMTLAAGSRLLKRRRHA